MASHDAVPVYSVGTEILAILEDLKVDKVSMAGSGVSQFDMRWIARFMPHLRRRLTYYSIDMGTFERVYSVLTGKGIRASRSEAAHRAVDDILFAHSTALSYSDFLTEALGA